MRWLGVVAGLVIGGVWIAAGALKLPDPAESVRAVRAYQLLPETVVPTVGCALPVIELVVGLCLVVGLLVRPAAVVSWLIFGAFIIGIASAWPRGLQTAAVSAVVASSPMHASTTHGRSPAMSDCCSRRPGWSGGRAVPGRWTTGCFPRLPRRRGTRACDEQEAVQGDARGG